jgi:hypothetical protein
MVIINELFKSRLSENKSYKVRYKPYKYLLPISAFNIKYNHYQHYYFLVHKSFYFLDKSIKPYQNIHLLRNQCY